MVESLNSPVSGGLDQRPPCIWNNLSIIGLNMIIFITIISKMSFLLLLLLYILIIIIIIIIWTWRFCCLPALDSRSCWWLSPYALGLGFFFWFFLAPSWLMLFVAFMDFSRMSLVALVLLQVCLSVHPLSVGILSSAFVF